MSEPPHRVVNPQLQSMAAASQEKKRMLVLIDLFSVSYNIMVMLIYK